MSTPARPASPGSYDVAVVGGGPVGMWLAAELHRGGVRPVVLERHAKRPTHSKALTIYPRTIEQFAMRGIADRWLAEGTPVPSTHFAILRNRLDMSFLDTRHPYTLFLPQRRTEELLEEHLAELGVPYLTEHIVTGMRQDEKGVDLDVDSPRGPAGFRAAYVVGCDGARSVIRAAAGIDFAGTPDTWRTIMGDVELTSPPQAPALTINQPGGSLYMVALGGGRYRLATVDHATMYSLSEGPVPFEELRASALRIAETDFGMRETADAWLSRVGNATRQAVCYRAGRVLLAGDAAHIHYPAGGQGLNLGLQDAGNLAWKLAAEIRGWAPPGLLDTYHAERYPVGLDVIDSSLAQCGLFANASREGIALRDQFNAILGTDPALCRELAIRLSGIAIRYPATGHMEGQRVPDLDLRGAPAATIFGLLHPAKFLLLTQGTAVDAPAGYRDRLDIVTAELTADRPEWAGVRSMLIRPDGYIAWATDADDPPPFAGWLGSALCSRPQDPSVRELARQALSSVEGGCLSDSLAAQTERADRAGPTLILASTSSSHASGTAPKSAACSQTHESACSDPQLCPAVPRHPDTLTSRPSTWSMPVTWPSGTTASSLVRGSGARYSTGGRNGRNDGCSPVIARSQRALCSPSTACPQNWPEPAVVSGGKALKTCLITVGGWPRSRSRTVH
jgi:2-polyprenyl-6-methoxyphenol hydroxylase-like FAD-dependent oxidoreductase